MTFQPKNEVVEAYGRWTGRGEIHHWPFYAAFSMFRLAAIAQGVYKRGLDGNASSTRALEMGRLVKILSAPFLSEPFSHLGGITYRDG